MTTAATPARYKGVSSYNFGSAFGTIRAFHTPQDVIDVFGDDLGSVIALVESGGTTFLSPILGRLGGIVCTSGTSRSHLAIVSREYEVPCLLAVDLADWMPADGDAVRMESSSDNEGWLMPASEADVSGGSTPMSLLSCLRIRRHLARGADPPVHLRHNRLSCHRLVELHRYRRRRDRAQALSVIGHGRHSEAAVS